jgi:hypothetical protein
LFENLECFSTIAYQMEKHIQNWMKKLEQSRGINILQTINSLHRKSLCIGIKPFDKACQLLHTRTWHMYLFIIKLGRHVMAQLPQSDPSD